MVHGSWGLQISYFSSKIQKSNECNSQSKINTFPNSEHLNIYVLCRMLCNALFGFQVMEASQLKNQWLLVGHRPSQVHVSGTFSILIDFNVQSIFFDSLGLVAVGLHYIILLRLETLLLLLVYIRVRIEVRSPIELNTHGINSTVDTTFKSLYPKMGLAILNHLQFKAL